MKRKLYLKKETLRTLSVEHLEQIAGGTNNGTLDACDAPMFCLVRRLNPLEPVGVQTLPTAL